ncbi:NAD(+)/NADH kinase [Dehalogenimonas sp. THU2]|uniref:NAD(+)/NADH kinase n=1 Tax=Dehalogenimonas sp. THU2 TaxID=3151121 RepID=UPI00321866F8
MIFKRIGLIYHPLNKAALDLAKEIAAYLDQAGCGHWLGSAWDGERLRGQMADTDLIVTTGGDGTILRAAQAVLPLDIPITSVNLGKLGFMTEMPAAEALELLPKLLAGDGWSDYRTVLEAEFLPHDKKEQPDQSFFAVNDVVAARGGIARIISVACHIDSAHYATYKGDGVIVASATGSTGYSFAAGGPVLYPQSADILLTPILPHLGRSYSLVTPADKTISLKISTNHQATMCIDGHINMSLSTGDVINVRTSRHRLHFLRLRQPDSFYVETDHKLKGSRT